MNLDLTRQEMETLLSLTAGMAHVSDQADSLWRKVSKEVWKELPFKTEEAK
jgi:hypothetical protein